MNMVVIENKSNYVKISERNAIKIIKVDNSSSKKNKLRQ